MNGIGWAIKEMQQGAKVARAGWNGKGMFLFLVPGSTFQVNRAPLLGIYPQGTEIKYQPHIDMKTAQDTVVPWLASQTDILATDWELLRPEMNTLRSILHDLSLLTYSVAGVFLCVVLWKGYQIEKSVIPVVGQVNIALATVNAPCKDDGHQVVCGTLAGVNQAVKNTGILAAQSAEQVKESGVLIASAATTITTVGQHLSGTADALSETATTASRSLQDVSDHLTPVLSHADATVGDLDAGIKALQPSEVALNKSIADFDTVLKPIPAIEANVQVSTFNLGQTTTDFQVKFHGFLYPPPCKTFGCKLARTWPYVKGATEMVEPAYWLQQAIKGATP